jgi:DNA repair exonuclease SbcCD nuclease subunit
MRFCFVHAADLHLDTPFSGIGKVDPDIAGALQEASLQAFDALVELAIARTAKFVLFSGDIYDGPERGVRAQLRFLSGLRRLDEASIRSFIVHGNHDPLLTGWSAMRGGWPRLVTQFGHHEVGQVPVEQDGETVATVCGISFAQRNETANLALRFDSGSADGLRVAMLHCNVGGIREHDPYAPCSLEDLIGSGFDYWALGHIHRRRILREGDPWIVYPGNLQGRSPRTEELGPKGALVVEVNDRDINPPEFVPLDRVRFARIDLDATELPDLPVLQEGLLGEARALQVASEGRPLLLRASVTGRSPLHRDLVREGAVDGLLQVLRDEVSGTEPFLWWDEVEDRTLPERDLDKVRKGKDFAAELLSVADELKGADASRQAFAEKYLAELPAGELKALGVELPPSPGPADLDEAAVLALDVLGGEER